MTLYYVNIRGIKSKAENLKSIIEEEKPYIIGIVETMLGEKEKMELKEYQIIRNDRDIEGGGVLLAVRKALGNVTIEVNRENS